ncbi:MAG: pantoate--beta-alanine ligase [Candidatus Sumerlaeaceae bacterium]|nr:pantoate--beta-alanine ligase [Candidatus Sumerlaeaceae bacterium]
MALQKCHSRQSLGEVLDSLRAAGNDWALVPTMGALHDGHVALIRQAKAVCREVVVSVFVNPLQFGPSEDFRRYPRDVSRDAEIVRRAGGTVVFAPSSEEMIPKGLTVEVDPGRLGRVLCGRSRPGHFRGVCTIVAKLLNIVEPRYAFFGWKDAQQLVILRAMVRDLNMSVELVGCETIRESDGLAMSSRNVYLSKRERRMAPELYRALRTAWEAYAQFGERRSARLEGLVRQHVAQTTDAKLDYVKAVSLDDLTPLKEVEQGNTLLALAAWVGKTRLIDNVRL